MSFNRNLKIAHAQVLAEMNRKQEEIARFLNITQSTVSSYLKISSEQVRELKEFIRKIYLQQEFTLAKKAFDEILARLQDEKERKKIRFYDLVGLYKIARDAGKETNITSANQFNISIVSDKESKTFRIEDAK